MVLLLLMRRFTAFKNLLNILDKCTCGYMTWDWSVLVFACNYCIRFTTIGVRLVQSTCKFKVQQTLLGYTSYFLVELIETWWIWVGVSWSDHTGLNLICMPKCHHSSQALSILPFFSGCAGQIYGIWKDLGIHQLLPGNQYGKFLMYLWQLGDCCLGRSAKNSLWGFIILTCLVISSIPIAVHPRYWLWIDMLKLNDFQLFAAWCGSMVFILLWQRKCESSL